MLVSGLPNRNGNKHAAHVARCSLCMLGQCYYLFLIFFVIEMVVSKGPVSRF